MQPAATTAAAKPISPLIREAQRRWRKEGTTLTYDKQQRDTTASSHVMRCEHRSQHALAAILRHPHDEGAKRQFKLAHASKDKQQQQPAAAASSSSQQQQPAAAASSSSSSSSSSTTAAPLSVLYCNMACCVL
jgi:hypothetical protein